MGDVGACWDNAVVERFFGSLKGELIHHSVFSTRAAARAPRGTQTKSAGAEPQTKHDPSAVRSLRLFVSESQASKLQ